MFDRGAPRQLARNFSPVYLHRLLIDEAGFSLFSVCRVWIVRVIGLGTSTPGGTVRSKLHVFEGRVKGFELIPFPVAISSPEKECEACDGDYDHRYNHRRGNDGSLAG